MYKEILRGIDHIEVWPVVSFVIFFLFFLMMLWWVMSVDGRFIRTMSEMPLDDNETPDKHQNDTTP